MSCPSAIFPCATSSLMLLISSSVRVIPSFFKRFAASRGSRSILPSVLAASDAVAKLAASISNANCVTCLNFLSPSP